MVQEGTVTVEQVNEVVKEAGGIDNPNPPLSKKQQEKQEKEAKRYWSTMISRKEAYEMVQTALQETDQRMQMLFVQNRTLIELIEKKGIATLDEINELSKSVIESIFGTPPVDGQEEQKEKEEETSND
jgi:hypothetical protein